MATPTSARNDARRRCSLFAASLSVGVLLTGCSPEGPPAPREPSAASARLEASSDPATAVQTEVIGAVDDLQALDTFLRINAAEARSSPPDSVVARTVEGGRDHRRMTLVYMTDPAWCGSGGCTLFILVPTADGLAEFSRVTLVNPPVLVLDTRTNGMPDISVRVRSDYYPGDGEKFVVLPFNGQTYASNPTVPPARLLRGPPDGEVAVSEGEVAIAFGR